jgi:hypothetical protein
MQDTMREAIDLHRNRLLPVLKTPPAKRDAAVVDRALRAAEPSQRELNNLTEALGEAPHYGNEQVEQARLAAERYAAARTTMMQTTIRCLQAGTRWTAEDEAGLQKQITAVAELGADWEKLLERGRK